MWKKATDVSIYNVEVSGFCNLHCPSCPRGNYAGSHDQPKGYMSPELFSAILDKIVTESPGYEPYLTLFNWGEPTLHPELPRLIEIARAKGLAPHLSSNLAAPKNLKDIVKARPASLRISLSGYYPKTYKLTHAPGDVRLVISNVYRLRAHLDSLGIKVPVHFCYHKYRHNLGADFKKISELAAAVQFELLPIWAQFCPLEKLLDYYAGVVLPADQAILELMVIKPNDFRAVSLRHRAEYPDCFLRSHQMTIDFDGSVALCCAVYDRKNYLEGFFLDHQQADFQEQKYQHALCGCCRQAGADITYIYGALEELNAIALTRIRASDIPYKDYQKGIDNLSNAIQNYRRRIDDI